MKTHSDFRLFINKPKRYAINLKIIIYLGICSMIVQNVMAYGGLNSTSAGAIIT